MVRFDRETAYVDVHPKEIGVFAGGNIVILLDHHGDISIFFTDDAW